MLGCLAGAEPGPSWSEGTVTGTKVRAEDLCVATCSRDINVCTDVDSRWLVDSGTDFKQDRSWHPSNQSVCKFSFLRFSPIEFSPSLVVRLTFLIKIN